MRIWSIHPKYLDTKGILAVWRETLLAQKVLLGETKGYKNHPQLIRFKKAKDPILAIGCYLREVQLEATRRGYTFDATKIIKLGKCEKIDVTKGQIEFEWQHFKLKLKTRNVEVFKKVKGLEKVELHPLFQVVKGGKEYWEKG